ncbi:hypothetical protein VPNG_09238 [Cytospora leucostoma]|uniref:Uncharacterized protein n=1 Tax=Cytospora leucostoma TaxID=1230097 RepID=A0A423W0M0_9PEZI|nr:hypothetical protein VPNG_09238 [Cytospora leucostoma]
MPGINQLPAGAEWAAAISLTWATTSLICSSLLLWLTWAHSEGRSYLALLSISSIFSNLFSIIQQCRDVTWYVDIQTEAFERKLSLPADDPELAISDEYYLYNVQALLVMFWAAELCQLTYQIGERRNMRRLLRNLHMAGKFISWLLPMITIACLQVSSLKESFIAFILIADLPLMISLAMGSGLMIAVLIRYIHTRQRFTHWNPPKFSSTTNSEAGTTTASSCQNTGGRRGLYDRWLMVRFTIAFVLLAVFEVTNTLFQITALKNNIHDAQNSAPDLSTARAIQTLFLDMPGTTPGIFIFVVFGTTASSRAKLADLLVPAGWRENTRGCFRLGSRQASTPPVRDPLTSYDSGIHVQRSLTITSTRRGHMSYINDEDLDSSDTGDVFLTDLPKRPESTAPVWLDNDEDS